MGRRRLTAGIVMASIGLAIGVLSLMLGFLISVNTDTEVVMDENDMTVMDENEYYGRIYYDSLSSVSRARVLSRADQEFDFNLIIRDPDGWIVKNQTDTTPFNRPLGLTNTMLGYYEVRLKILTPGIDKEDVRFEVLGRSSDPIQTSGCTMFMCFGMVGGMLVFFGAILVISHFFGLYEDEDRLKIQPDSTPVDVVGPAQSMVGRVPQGVTIQPPQGMSRYQYARHLESSGRFAEAYHIYVDLDLPLDAARCQTLYNTHR